jgi:hypothetical protein
MAALYIQAPVPYADCWTLPAGGLLKKSLDSKASDWFFCLIKQT